MQPTDSLMDGIAELADSQHCLFVPQACDARQTWFDNQQAFQVCPVRATFKKDADVLLRCLKPAE